MREQTEAKIKEMKEWIDSASYSDLLRKWRFATVGDPFFIGEVGEYYQEAMREKRNEVGQRGHVAASKQIGWKKP